MTTGIRNQIREALAARGLAPDRAPILRRALQTTDASFSQRAIWLAHQSRPSGAYNILAGVMIAGEVSISALTAAIETVGRRHEILRTALVLEGSRLRQVVADGIVLSPRVIDLTTEPDNATHQILQRLIRAEEQHVFDLAQPPLARFSILRLPARRTALLINLHHCISDAWSQELLGEEIAQAYEALLAGRPIVLPEMIIQYADFSDWQRALVEGQCGKAQVAYWRDLLVGAPAVHGLPLDHSRHESPEPASGRITAPLNETVEMLLRNFCRDQRNTTFNVLFAMFAAALGRFSATEDLVLGFAHSNRARPETRRLMGCLVGALPARFDLATHPTLRQLAALTRARTLEALENGDIPLERLVDELQVPRHPLVHPLFQMLFEYHESASGLQRPQAAVVQPLDASLFGARAAKFEVLLSVAKDARGHILSWEWNAALFDRCTMEAFIGAFGKLLEAALRHPDQPLESLPVASEQDGSVACGAPVSFESDPADWLSATMLRWAHERPHEPAVIDSDICLTVQELAAAATNLASTLRDCGVGAGSRVALVLKRSAAAVVGLLAIHEVGATCVALDPLAPAARINDMLTRSACSLALTDAAQDRAPFDALPTIVLERSGRPALRATPLGTVVAAAPDAEPLSYIVFTSGSTGIPKGVLVSRRNVAHFLRGMHARFGWVPGLRYSLAINLSTDIGLQNVFCALAFGGTIVVMPEPATKDPAEFSTWMARNPIDVSVFTPSHFCALHQPALFNTPHPRDTLLLEGEALTPQMISAIATRAPGVRISNGYGPTEATMLVSVHDVNVTDGCERVPIGLPLSNVVLRIVNRNGLTQPRYATGELWIESPTVGCGYCGEPSMRDGFDALPDGKRRYRTGDLARLRPDGAIEFLGRRDNQAKIRGYRIEPGEIEVVLRAVPGVRLAAVRCTRNANGDGQIAAYVSWNDEAERLSAREMRVRLSRQLPEYMLPHRLISVESLPMLANGKINYNALPAASGAEPAAEPDVDLPETEVENALAEVWRIVLGVHGIQRTSNFFALGGNSIKTIQLIVEARRRGLNLSAADVHRFPTLRDLANAAKVTGAVDARQTLPAPFSLAPDNTRELLPTHIVDAFPLTSLQQAMVANQLRGGEHTRYLIISKHTAPPGLQVPALTQALATLIAQHPVLRTSIAAHPSGEYLQRVHSTASPRISTHDLRGLSASAQDAFAEQRMQHLRDSPMQLDEAPLFAIELLRRGADEYELIWLIHHVILDGWSIARLSDEAIRLHAQLASRLPIDPPPARKTLAQLVARERACIADEAERLHWQEYLAAASPALLPRGVEPAHLPAHRSPIRQVQIASAKVAQLTARAANCGVASKAVWFAIYSCMIGELCGVDRLLTGYCTHARDEDGDIAHDLGLYVRTLPALIDLRPCSWRELIVRAQQVEQTVWAHRFMPLEAIQKLTQGRAAFEHFFNFNDFHGFGAPAGRGVSGVSARVPSIYNLNEFTLTVNVVLGRPGQPATLYVSFEPDTLTESQADWLIRLLVHGVDEVCRDVEAPARLCTGAIRDLVINEWSGSTRARDIARCLHEDFVEQVRRSPSSIAVIDQHGSVTYEQLFLHARQIADRLLARHIEAGERVAINLPKGRAQIAAVFGVLLAGGTYVPVDTSWPQARRTEVFASAGVRIVISNSTSPGTDGTVEELDPGGPLTGDLECLLARSTPRQRPEDLAYVIYTSGSTGKPKGVAMEHRAVYNTLLALAEHVEITCQDRVLAISALTFDLSVYDIFAVLGAGGACVCPEASRGNDPAHWLELLERHGVTLWNTVPMAAQLLEEHLSNLTLAPRLIRSRVRQFLLSGDRIPPSLPPRLARRFGNPRVLSLGGATEAAIWSISYPITQDTTNWKSIPYGRALTNQRFYVLGASGQPLIPGATGELYIAGAGLARGYFADTERTEAAFFYHPELAQRVYRTGDFGRHLPDGNIEFLGRADGQIKLNGLRIELGEIEAALRSCDCVSDAVVVLRDPGTGPRHLVAYVVAREGMTPERGFLQRQLTARLPAYMVPPAIVILSALPLSANGKVDRSQLPAPPPEAMARGLFAEPETELQQELSALWKSHLSLSRVGIHDNFFELGGDSILALRMLAAWGRQRSAISLRDFYSQPTIARMAMLSERVCAAAPSRRYTGAIALLPAQAWLLNRSDPRREYFNQAVLLEAPHDIEPHRIQAALNTVAQRHDAFRLRFALNPNGWSARLADEVPTAAFRVLDLRGLTEPVSAQLRAETLREAHSFIDVERGPLLVAVLIRESSESTSLVLIAAHLAVDLVSWALLIEDLEILLREPNRPLPDRASSTLCEWATYLDQLGASPELTQHSEYWRKQLTGSRAKLPLTDPDGDASSRHLRRATVQVGGWPQLHATVNRHFRATAQELILCALYIALRDWTRQDCFGILIEGHGRGALPNGPDVVQTVGWLTTFAPVSLSARDGSLEDTLQGLLTDIRALPNSGVGYGVLRYLTRDPALSALSEPSISFNYLGEAGDLSGHLLRFKGGDTGPARPPEAAALFELSIFAVAAGDELHVSIEYGSRRFRRSSIDRLVRTLKGVFAELREVALQCAPAPDRVGSHG